MPGRPSGPRGTEVRCAAWSRRRFVAQSLFTMAVAAPALSRAAVRPAVESPPRLTSKPAAARAATGAAADTGSGAVHPAGFADDRLTTEVFIDGRGPYHFLVDTGAERTLIAEEIAAQLALPQGRRVMVEGIIQGRPSLLVGIERLEMGGLVCPHLEVPVLPRAMLGVDGYLGLDVLDRHRVIFDFRARTLTVTRPQGLFSSLWTHGDEAVVRTLGSSGRLRASDCRVNGVRAAAFIDSGAEVSVINPALFTELKRRAPRLQELLGREGLYGVTGGSIFGAVVNVEKIRLDELVLTYTTVVVAGLEVFDTWGLREQPALLFGMDCLHRFERVTIDYGRRELRFEIASTQPAPTLEAGLPPPPMA
jgi:gag-polyprotein putative aspartyl protease